MSTCFYCGNTISRKIVFIIVSVIHYTDHYSLKLSADCLFNIFISYSVSKISKFLSVKDYRMTIVNVCSISDLNVTNPLLVSIQFNALNI